MTHVDDTGSNATRYTDIDVEPEGRYTHRIKGRNPAGVSPESSYFDTKVPQPPAVTVSFQQSTYTVEEGQNVNITVELDGDPDRTATIPVLTTEQAGASDDDP